MAIDPGIIIAVIFLAVCVGVIGGTMERRRKRYFDSYKLDRIRKMNSPDLEDG